MAVSPQQPHRRRIGFAVLLILVGLLGCIVGLGSFTFVYAKGTSYITDDAAACANCHVMREVYTAWSRGSHRNVAVCNDCHVPHSSIVTKYAIKVLDGVRHSTAFTLDNFQEPILITDMDRDIVKDNCVSCHGSLTSMINHDRGNEDCLRCHARVGHDE